MNIVVPVSQTHHEIGNHQRWFPGGGLNLTSICLSEKGSKRKKGRGRKRTSPRPCNVGSGNPGENNPENCNPGNDATEEPGMRDNSGLPVPAPDREVKSIRVVSILKLSQLSLKVFIR